MVGRERRWWGIFSADPNHSLSIPIGQQLIRRRYIAAEEAG